MAQSAQGIRRRVVVEGGNTGPRHGNGYAVNAGPRGLNFTVVRPHPVIRSQW